MTGITWRLVHLQVVRHDYFQQRATEQRQKNFALTPPRGEIVDRRGNILAHSVISRTIYADPTMIRARKQSPELTARVIAEALGEKDVEDLQQMLARVDTSFVRLRRKLDPSKAAAVERAIASHKLVGLGMEDEPVRVYPNKNLAAHVIGYVNAEGRGQAGLELLRDEYLRGVAGKVRLETDALGQPYYRQDDPARSGARIVTTLDLALQSRVEAALELAWRETRSKAAAATVLDVKTGEILALANFPTFDPNIRPKSYKDLKAKEAEEAARRNRVITDYYEPGSVFKIVTYSAALEERLVRPEEKINCLNGRIEIFGRVIGDHVSGWLSASQALAKSSNVGAIQLALKIAQTRGEERLVEYMNRFGFGRRTGIDLPGEIKGVVRQPRQWHKTTIGSVAIGQEVGVTVLQMVAAMAAIGNRGVWLQPHVVKQIIGPENQVVYESQPESRRVVSEQTALELAGMLEQVVIAGTARHAVKLTGYTAAGKTGTPQKVDSETKRYSKTKFMPTFAGFVPASDPRFAIIVMLDEPIGLHQGGQVSAPVFNLIAEAALLDYSVTPDSPEFRQALDVLAANLREQMNRSQDKARSEESALSSLPIEPDNKRHVHDSQMASLSLNVARPLAIPASLRSTSISSGIMPDLRGRSSREVAQICIRLDLRANLIGSGLAVHQTPAPGVPIQPGDSCRIEFE